MIVPAIIGLSQCSGETPKPTSPRSPDGPVASEAPSGSQVATVTVQTNTSGSSLDPDGYSFTVTLDKASIAANCAASDTDPRTVSVAPGGTVTATFEVTCSDVATTGSLTVTAATTGSDLDPDGYTVTVDGTLSKAVATSGSVSFPDLAAGSHTVELSGLASNCSTSDSPQTATLTAAGTTTVSMSVACEAIPAPEVGDLSVTTTTSGADIDPDGYMVTLDADPATTKTVGPNGSVTFPGLAAGSHSVALSGLQSNCAVSGPNPQAGVVVTGGSVTVAFSVACQAFAGNLTVNVSTGGTQLDPDGYTVTLDGSVSRPVGINGSVTFDGIAVGSHTIALSGLAPTCSLLNNPRTVSVALGQTTQTALAVECTTLYTLVGAGDIASCAWDGDEATAKLLDAVVASDPGATVFVAGDNVYDAATATELNDCFGPTWGRHKSRMYAALGNKDYWVDPNPSWDYFGDRAGPRGKGYFSFDLGDYWHVIILNDNWGHGGPSGAAGSTQDKWLVADLAANTKPCTIAIWHQAYVASGWTVSTQRKNFWSRLYDAGAELVLSGHVHHYERFAPQTPDLVRDDARGVREFVVGTGGTPPNGIGTRKANSEAVKGGTNGVLKLTLGARTYSWEFIPVAGKTFTDSGTGTCH